MSWGKNEEDSRWSAALFVGLWMGLLVISIILFCGVVEKNKISDAVVNSPHVFVGTLVITTALTILRYFKFVKLQAIVEWRSNLSIARRRLMYSLMVTIVILLPVLSFIAFRLYQHGCV